MNVGLSNLKFMKIWVWIFLVYFVFKERWFVNILKVKNYF